MKATIYSIMPGADEKFDEFFQKTGEKCAWIVYAGEFWGIWQHYPAALGEWENRDFLRQLGLKAKAEFLGKTTVQEIELKKGEVHESYLR